MKLGFTTGTQILKKESMQWKRSGSPPPKKFRTQPSASKVMATVFWSCRVAQAAIRECKFEQLNHPPYSPDLAPSDYYLFRNLKSHLRRTRFRDDDELKAATEAWFEDQIDHFYFKGIDCLKEKWAKCIEVKGDYIEKIMLKPSSNL